LDSGQVFLVIQQSSGCCNISDAFNADGMFDADGNRLVDYYGSTFEPENFGSRYDPAAIEIKLFRNEEIDYNLAAPTDLWFLRDSEVYLLGEDGAVVLSDTGEVLRMPEQSTAEEDYSREPTKTIAPLGSDDYLTLECDHMDSSLFGWECGAVEQPGLSELICYNRAHEETWRLSLEKELCWLSPGPDGLVIAAGRRQLTAVKAGEVLWTYREVDDNDPRPLFLQPMFFKPVVDSGGRTHFVRAQRHPRTALQGLLDQRVYDYSLVTLDADGQVIAEQILPFKKGDYRFVFDDNYLLYAVDYTGKVSSFLPGK